MSYLFNLALSLQWICKRGCGATEDQGTGTVNAVPGFVSWSHIAWSRCYFGRTDLFTSPAARTTRIIL